MDTILMVPPLYTTQTNAYTQQTHSAIISLIKPQFVIKSQNCTNFE